MKTQRVFTILMFLTLNALSQSKFDQIDHISINGVEFGSDIEEIRLAIGEPDTVTRDFNEMEEISVDKLHYSKSRFFLSNGRVSSFDIKDDEFKILPFDLCVGSKESELKEAFPLSYSNMECGAGWKVLRIYLYDTIISFVIRDGIVTNIYSNEQ